ncbi:MAG TPA: hypothetical protein ENH01_02515 [Nitrospirae bacterium]|nr:hypothetical protein [Nitrospirota bacterium]
MTKLSRLKVDPRHFDEGRAAVGIYELFIAGRYEKIEEVDDSIGSMGMFFEELFCSWISARQKPGLTRKKQSIRW